MAARRTDNAAGGVPLDDDELLPILPDIPDAEPFPVDALPSTLAKAVIAIATLRQVPPAMAAQSVLAVASLACQSFANVRTPANSIAPLSLYLVTLAATGARKSASDGDAMRPIRLYEEDLRDSFDLQRQAYETASAVYEADRKSIIAKKMASAERREKLDQLGPKPLPPLRPHLTFSDTTFEALVKVWPEMPGALGLFSSDAGTFLGGWSVKGEGKLLAGAGLSTIWDGATYHRNRSADGMTSLYGRRLALHMMIQPDASLDFLNDPIFKAQGFLSRLLISYPPNLNGTRKFVAPEQTALAALDRYADDLHDVLRRPWPLRERSLNELEPRELGLDVDAMALWCEFYDEVESQCGKDGRFADLSGFGEKAGEMACRLAGIFALIGNPLAQVIGADVMLSAIRLMEWYLAENVRVRGWAASARIIADKPGKADAAYRFDQAAQKLLDWVRAQTTGTEYETTRKFLMQFGPAETRKAANLSVALNTLRGAGYIIDPPEPPPGQKRSKRLTFNLR